jgi:hypothetical protein
MVDNMEFEPIHTEYLQMRREHDHQGMPARDNPAITSESMEHPFIMFMLRIVMAQLPPGTPVAEIEKEVHCILRMLPTEQQLEYIIYWTIRTLMVYSGLSLCYSILPLEMLAPIYMLSLAAIQWWHSGQNPPALTWLICTSMVILQYAQEYCFPEGVLLQTAFLILATSMDAMYSSFVVLLLLGVAHSVGVHYWMTALCLGTYLVGLRHVSWSSVFTATCHVGAMLSTFYLTAGTQPNRLQAILSNPCYCVVQYLAASTDLQLQDSVVCMVLYLLLVVALCNPADYVTPIIVPLCLLLYHLIRPLLKIGHLVLIQKKTSAL